ncbi:MAG: hypothetical protein ACP5UO_04355 [Thermoplasmata archaeon]
MSEDYEELRELKREGEEIIFSSRLGRMMLLRELWDKSKSGMMEEISKKYGIDSRGKFLEFKEKYNLTDY